MKRLFYVFVVLSLLVSLFPVFVAAATMDSPLVVDLIAGQHTNVGSIKVWDDGTTLYVKYETVDPWCFTETHLAVASDLNGIPQKNGNPIPGQFPYTTDHKGCATSFTYTVPLIQDSCELYIAAHAAINSGETAWGSGLDFSGKNWATYFTYIPEACLFTATPTNTNTATPSATGTATGTPTFTSTPTDTVTATMTATSTSTGTVTATHTATSTATATATSTSTGTVTATHTATNTATATATNTATKTATATMTATHTATSTATATATNTATKTATATMTATRTPTSTATATATNTATATATKPACLPTVVTADFSSVGLGESVEGLNVVAPNLNINAGGTARRISADPLSPPIYISPNTGATVINGGLAPGGGFSDVDARNAGVAHLYTFTFAPWVSVNDFSVRMTDFGDFNPSLSTSHLVTMTAYNAQGDVVSSQKLSYTTEGVSSPTSSDLYGNMQLSGDATTSPGLPGNWKWHVSGNGITKVVLSFDQGYDPRIGLDTLSFACP